MMLRLLLPTTRSASFQLRGLAKAAAEGTIPAAAAAAVPVAAAAIPVVEKEKAKKKKKVPSPIRLRLPDDAGNTPAGNIKEWTKKIGDQIKESEALCEIENDHFSFDFQSNVPGWLAVILAHNGAKKVPAGEVIAVIAEEKEEIPSVVEMIEKEVKEGKLRIYTAPVEEVPDPHLPVAKPAPTAAAAAPATAVSSAAAAVLATATPTPTPPVAEKVSSEKAAAPAPKQELKDEVKEFLHSVHQELAVYSSVLKSDGFDSVDALDTLKEADLERLGVKTGHRRILMKFLEKRKEKQGGKEEKEGQKEEKEVKKEEKKEVKKEETKN